jgi:NADH:ubiquinone oxidoreductase subunit E
MNNQMCQCKEESVYFEKLHEILRKYTGDEANLIPILQNIQEAYGFLPIDILNKM